MKCFTLLASLSALLASVEAHYIFQFLTYAGTEGSQYQYIRPNTNSNSPVIDLNSTDLRCNVGALTGPSTATIPVVAGQSFSFTADIAVYHDGPLSIYMAKVPSGSTASSFDGSGQVWFKILDLGPTFADGSVTWPLAQTYSYTIPPALPNGEYLLRIQQLAIHNPYPGGIPQFYISCAQISVSSGGSGTPGPLVSIPGFIDGTEPGYVVNIYYPVLTNYTVPGPALWAGQSAVGGGGSLTTLKTSTTSVKVSSTSVKTTSTSTKATSTTSSSIVVSTTYVKTSAASAPTGVCTAVALYGQCGGGTMTGCYTCTSGTCVYTNDYYSQCK